MQTTSDPHNNGVRTAIAALNSAATAAPARPVGPAVADARAVRRPVAARLALLAAALVLAAVALLAVAPGEAFAKSYDMTKVDITAQAETDGSLHAVEQRTFDFNGDFTAVWWTFEGLPSNAELKVNSMRMARVDGDGNVVGEWETLPSVPFVLSWRDAGGPGTDAYSVDAPMNTVYAFFDVSDEKAVIELDYTVVNGVQAYKDVAEVNWKYVGDQWEESSADVTMTLALPVPQGVAVEPGENVRAWGHGPLDGSLAINADGSVAYTVPKVNAGQYAEARVVFPVAWLTNLSPDAAKLHADEMRLDKVLADEEDWADQANRNRMQSLAFVIGCGVLCVLLIAWALWSYFRYGKEHAPSFTDEYWRDVPDPRVHPAAIGRLWRWDRESQDDFTATLMHLRTSAPSASTRGSVQEPDAFGRTETSTTTTSRDCPRASGLDPLDRRRSISCSHLCAGADSLWFGTIEQYGKDHPRGFRRRDEGWQGTCRPRRTAGLLRGQGQALPGVPRHARRGGGSGRLAIGLVMDNFIPLIFMVPTAIALGVIATTCRAVACAATS